MSDDQRKATDMTDSDVDELGPVDYIVVEFPADQANFSGEMASELSALVNRGVVRVLDLLFLKKELDGSVEGFESHERRRAASPARSPPCAARRVRRRDPCPGLMRSPSHRSRYLARWALDSKRAGDHAARRIPSTARRRRTDGARELR
jgi:hypothetical protein